MTVKVEQRDDASIPWVSRHIAFTLQAYLKPKYLVARLAPRPEGYADIFLVNTQNGHPKDFQLPGAIWNGLAVLDSQAQSQLETFLDGMGIARPPMQPQP